MPGYLSLHADRVASARWAIESTPGYRSKKRRRSLAHTGRPATGRLLSGPDHCHCLDDPATNPPYPDPTTIWQQDSVNDIES